MERGSGAAESESDIDIDCCSQWVLWIWGRIKWFRQTSDKVKGVQLEDYFSDKEDFSKSVRSHISAAAWSSFGPPAGVLRAAWPPAAGAPKLGSCLPTGPTPGGCPASRPPSGVPWSSPSHPVCFLPALVCFRSVWDPSLEGGVLSRFDEGLKGWMKGFQVSF